MQFSYAQLAIRKSAMIDLENAFRLVAPQVLHAALATAKQLESLGIRYALAGGLAVAAHGYLRATDDVDFLVGDEAFEKHGNLVSFKAGVPIQIDGIRIDYLSPAALGKHVETSFKSTGELHVVPIEVLIYMKLVAKRRQDQLDIVELLKRTTQLKVIHDYMDQYAKELLPLFDELALEANSDN
jgi:hypothetical protein